MQMFYVRNLYYVILLFILAYFNIVVDSDYFFHVVAGEYIVTTASLPHVDVFSYTMQGQPWVMHEWLYEVLIYLISEGGGVVGVSVFTSLMTVATVVVVVKTFKIERVWIELLLAFVVVILIYPFFIPRPQVITFLYLSLYLFGLLRLRFYKQSAPAKWLPLLMLVWVNSHGGYIVGIFLILAFIVVEFLECAIRKINLYSNRYLRTLFALLAATVLASLMNPYFAAHLLFPFKLVSQEAVMMIFEWGRPDFGHTYFQLYLGFFALFILLCLLFVRGEMLGYLLVPLGFIVGAFSAIRHLPLAVISIAPFMAYVCALLNRKKKELPGVVSVAEEDGRAQLLVSVPAIMLSLLMFAYNYGEQHKDDEKVLNERYPVRASEFIVKNNLSGNMFNTYQSGGYLLYRMFPARKVFIDIRADMYGDEFMRNYMTIVDAKEGWKSLLEQYEINYLLVGNDDLINAALRSSDEYARIYIDENFCIYIRNIDYNKGIITEFSR